MVLLIRAKVKLLLKSSLDSILTKKRWKLMPLMLMPIL